MEKEKDGVWRTIRGRRIFIASGESLGEAMAKSGKFKREDIREAKANLRTEDYMNKIGKKSISVNDKKYEKEVDKHFKKKAKKNEYTKFGYEHDDSKQAEKNRINENGKTYWPGDTRVERYSGKYSETDRRELDHEELQKKLFYERMDKNSGNDDWDGEAEVKKYAKETGKTYEQANRELRRDYRKYEDEKEKRIADFKAKKQSNNKDVWQKRKEELVSGKNQESERELYERAKNNPESIDPMTENSTDWEALEKKYGKQEIEANGIKLLKVKDNEKGTYIEDLTNKYNELAKQGKGNADTYKSLKKEIADLRKDNKKYEATKKDILEGFTEDFGWEDTTPEKAFIEQIDSMKTNAYGQQYMSTYQAGKEYASGASGTMLVYNQDMVDYLKTKGIRANINNAFDKYTDYMGRSIERIYNEIKEKQNKTINNYKKRKGK